MQDTTTLLAAPSAALTASFLRPTEDFHPTDQTRPVGGSSPEIQFFEERSTRLPWIGKCSLLAITSEEALSADLQVRGVARASIGRYTEEVREILGLKIYEALGLTVPKTALCYQPVTTENQTQYDCHTPRLHFFSQFVTGFHPLGETFWELYKAHVQTAPNEYMYIVLPDGRRVPLKGFGAMLAAADFIYDADCIGNSGGNVGYILQEDVDGNVYAQLVKIDGGYTFSFAHLAQTHNPLRRDVLVSPQNLNIRYADLNTPDQKEFSHMAKHVLATPNTDFEALFEQVTSIADGIPAHELQEMLQGLIARKSLFLAAFADEADAALVHELETARARFAQTLESSDVASGLIAPPSADITAQLRAKLAALQTQHTEVDAVCRTFQLPPANALFTGRTECLMQLAQQLHHDHGSLISQSISGLGGIGKTQLAIAYAHAGHQRKRIGEITPQYTHIIWIHAESGIASQFQSIAEAWCHRAGLPPIAAVETVYRFLQNQPALLIFDNAVSLSDLQPYLPPEGYTSSLHLLITSRNPHWGEMPQLPLAGFTFNESRTFIEQQLGAQDDHSIQAVLELLVGLPLAISQAIAYIKAGHVSLENYPQQFRLNQADLFSHALLQQDPHLQTVGSTFTLSLARACAQVKETDQVMNISAYLAPECISYALIAEILNLPLDKVETALTTLSEYSLVTLDIANRTFQVHRLVQELLRYQHQKKSVCAKFISSIFSTVAPYFHYAAGDLRAIKAAKSYTDHTMHSITHALQLVPAPEEQINCTILLTKLGKHYLYDIKEYAKARDIYARALAIFRQHLDPSHDLVITALIDLANAHGVLGDPGHQCTLLEEALQLVDASSLPYPATHTLLHNLGDTYRTLKKPRKAKKTLERALSLKKELFGQHHPENAPSLSALGNVYRDLGDLKRSKVLITTSLHIEENHFGPEHPQITNALIFLSETCDALGEVEQECQLLERCLHIREKHYEPEHVEIIAILHYLTRVYKKLGKIERERDLLERILAAEEKTHGKTHPTIIATLVNLGIAHGELGNPAGKRDCCKRAWEISESHFGPTDPEGIRILVNLGAAYYALEEYELAKNVLTRTLQVKEQHYGPDHFELANTLVNLGNAYGGLKDFKNQILSLERGIKLEEQHYGFDHLEVAKSIYNLATAYLNIKNYHTALQHAERTATIFHMHLPPEHPHHQTAASMVRTCKRAIQAERNTAPPPNVSFLNTSHIQKLNQEAIRCYKNKEFFKASKVFELIISYCRLPAQIAGDQTPLRNALYNLGNSEFECGQFEKAHEHLQEAVHIEEALSQKEGRAIEPKYSNKLASCVQALHESRTLGSATCT